MRQRAAQQRITPDVQTGCICCASGDGRFGGPIWWNTPLEEAEETAEQNRALWGQGEPEPEPEPEERQQQPPGGSGGEEEEEEEAAAAARRQAAAAGEEEGPGGPPAGCRAYTLERCRQPAFSPLPCGLPSPQPGILRCHASVAGASRKRPYEEDEEEEMDDEVKKRLAALRG